MLVYVCFLAYIRWVMDLGRLLLDRIEINGFYEVVLPVAGLFHAFRGSWGLCPVKRR